MSNFTPAHITGAWIFQGIRHEDTRGWFQELFKNSEVKDKTGFDFCPVQINLSYSFQGVIRGIHYSIASEGQAKYVSVIRGTIDDYIIDVRVGSPTFGQWEKVTISAEEGNGVLLGSNLAHAFQATSDAAIVCYAVTAEFNPNAELAINPMCPELEIEWNANFEAITSPKDSNAPGLATQLAEERLPHFQLSS